MIKGALGRQKGSRAITVAFVASFVNIGLPRLLAGAAASQH